MKRTKILALLLALVMIAGLFAACNGGETGTTTATEATTTEATTATSEATAATTEAIATTTEATTTATSEATATETTEDPFAAFAGKEFTFSIKNCGGLYGDRETERGTGFTAALDGLMEKYGCEISVTHDGDAGKMDWISGSILSNNAPYSCLTGRQSTWIPCLVNGYLFSMDELSDRYGLDFTSEETCNQYYTRMSRMFDKTWCLDFTGKYFYTKLGHFYAFNGDLTNAAGYSSDEIHQAIRDFKWDYDMFLDIAGKITSDTDGDGKPDVWGVALDTDGNEAWSNGTGPIIQNADGKWTANLQDPGVLESLEFMYKLSGPEYEYPVYGDTVGRGDRRSMFYAGQAGFAGLYGGNIEEEGTGSVTGFEVGIAPIPHGPRATNYCMNVVDCDFVFIPMNVKDIDLVCTLLNDIGLFLTDWDDYQDELAVNLNGSETCLEIINDYLLPNGKMNIAKCSDNMYQIVRKEFYRDIYTLEKTAAQAAEAYQDTVQAELDLVFKY